MLNGPASPPDRPPLTPEDWVLLNSNDRVCVQWENEKVNYATVDVVAQDASVFWIWLDNGSGRVALHEDDNISVWFEEDRTIVSPEQLPPSDTMPPEASHRPWSEMTPAYPTTSKEAIL